MRRFAGCRRFVRNLCLEQKTLEWHRTDPRRLSAFDQVGELAALKEAAPWLAEAPHHVLVQAILDLHKGFTAFFEGRSAFPTMQRKGERDSFRFPDAAQFRWVGEAVSLPKLGWVAWTMHRPVEGRPKSATITRVADRWYVSIQVERDVVEPAPARGPAVGVDLGVSKPITLSDGTVFALPRVSDAERRHMGALQKQLARRTKGSRNRRKTAMEIARLHARWARRRDDACHKATTAIAKSHGLIVVEDLHVAGMTASARGTVEEPGRNVRAKSGLNRALLDVRFGEIRRQLAYKAAWYGSRVVAVPAAHTSQGCPACGRVDAANRPTQARFRCVDCGHAADADVNAAVNVLARGLAATGTKLAA